MRGLKQVWDVDFNRVLDTLDKMGDQAELGAVSAVKKGRDYAYEELKPFFASGGEHHQTGATQKGLFKDNEVVNLTPYGGAITTKLGYHRKVGTGFVASYFERGTPRSAAKKRVPAYRFLGKVARSKELQNAMVNELERYMRRYTK